MEEVIGLPVFLEGLTLSLLSLLLLVGEVDEEVEEVCCAAAERFGMTRDGGKRSKVRR